jgi:hypothetical protein
VKKPAAHVGAQAAAPGALWDPEAQRAHADAPGLGAYVSATQGVAMAEPTGQKEPAGQNAQAREPGTL